MAMYLRVHFLKVGDSMMKKLNLMGNFIENWHILKKCLGQKEKLCTQQMLKYLTGQKLYLHAIPFFLEFGPQQI